MECGKSFVDRRPGTEYSLISVGRERLEAYLSYLEALIKVAKGG